MTDTDRATDGRALTGAERLAEAIESILTKVPLGLRPSPQQVATEPIAQGFGHQDDILRAFAEWQKWQYEGFLAFEGDADRYLASLAAKPDTKEENG